MSIIVGIAQMLSVFTTLYRGMPSDQHPYIPYRRRYATTLKGVGKDQDTYAQRQGVNLRCP